MANKDISHYSDSYSDSSFYLTENDISDLDLFFMYTDGKTTENNIGVVAKIIREPIFYFSIASHTQVLPIFQLGSKSTIGYSHGPSIIAGRIIINAFSNIPFVNSLIATETTSGRPQEMPPMDFYIINKKNSLENRYFQDLVVKDFKITSWNFEQGSDTPGRFVVAEWIASDFQGIHLKDYIQEQVHGDPDVDLAPEIQLDPFYTSRAGYATPDLLSGFISWVNLGSKWGDYENSVPTRFDDILLIRNLWAKASPDGDGILNIVDDISIFKKLLNELELDNEKFNSTYDDMTTNSSKKAELDKLRADGTITIDIDRFHITSSKDMARLLEQCALIVIWYNTAS